MINRPDWTEYFLSMAKFVSQRSIDESTKVGCIIARDKSIISTGYNSPPRGINDPNVPQIRPDKYNWFIHAEANAIANAAKLGVATDNCITYCTELPCPMCLGLLINAGCKEIYYSTRSAQLTNNLEAIKVITQMAKEANIKLIYISEKE